jgi:hypothetical protein
MKKITESAKIKKVIESTDLSEVNEAFDANTNRTVIKEVYATLRPILEAGYTLEKLASDLYPANPDMERTLKAIELELNKISSKLAPTLASVRKYL